jgi:hypothetical protein
MFDCLFAGINIVGGWCPFLGIVLLALSPVIIFWFMIARHYRKKAKHLSMKEAQIKAQEILKRAEQEGSGE